MIITQKDLAGIDFLCMLHSPRFYLKALDTLLIFFAESGFTKQIQGSTEFPFYTTVMAQEPSSYKNSVI